MRENGDYGHQDGSFASSFERISFCAQQKKAPDELHTEKCANKGRVLVFCDLCALLMVMRSVLCSKRYDFHWRALDTKFSPLA